jgi:MFS family permease
VAARLPITDYQPPPSPIRQKSNGRTIFAAPIPTALKVQRITVSAFFFFNGFLYANWAARLPELQESLGISHSSLGTLLFILAVGAVIGMPFTGWLAFRFGSAFITKLFAIALCFTFSTIGFPSSVAVEAVIFFGIGLFNGGMDVTMNEQAVLVERMWKKPIMSSFHGLWSVGMASGAGVGALFSKTHTPLPVHFITVAIVSLVFLMWASRYLIKSRPERTGNEKTFVLPTRMIAPLGLIAFCGMLSEGSVGDWSAIFMNKVIGATESFSALAFGAFAAGMTIGRFTGDYFTLHYGKKNLLIADSILAMTGMSIVLGFVSVWSTFVGFFFVGLGLATVVPLIYTTAGNAPGVSPSVGIAMATTIGYAGFFVGPPVIGYLADSFGLRIGLTFPLLLLVIMLGLIARVNFEKFKPDI